MGIKYLKLVENKDLIGIRKKEVLNTNYVGVKKKLHNSFGQETL